MVSGDLLVNPVRRTSFEYIKAAVSSSSKFEQSDGIDGNSSIAKVWSVKSCMLSLDSSKVKTAMKATIRYEFDAFGANLQRIMLP